MASSIAENKKELRRRVRQQLTEMTPEELKAADDAMFVSFLALPQVEAAQNIFAFLGIPGREPETERLLNELVARGKKVGLPRMLPEHKMEVRGYEPGRPLQQVAFGIREPGEDCPLMAPEDIDLVLVPAVCYDRRGYRLGFGGGYYDRWLEHFSGARVGLGRTAILQEEVPIEAHDTKVQVLITEKETLTF